MFVVVGAKETAALANLSFIFHPLFRNSMEAPIITHNTLSMNEFVVAVFFGSNEERNNNFLLEFIFLLSHVFRFHHC
jgi:hypothetical protein